MGEDLINETVWKEILEKCDLNGDGKISKNEFLKLVMEI